jgi:hypothetical protein
MTSDMVDSYSKLVFVQVTIDIEHDDEISKTSFYEVNMFKIPCDCRTL